MMILDVPTFLDVAMRLIAIVIALITLVLYLYFFIRILKLLKKALDALKKRTREEAIQSLEKEAGKDNAYRG